MEEFRKELQALINRHSLENTSDTPDYILAEFLIGCLKAFDYAIATREAWYGRPVPPTMPKLVNADEPSK